MKVFNALAIAVVAVAAVLAQSALAQHKPFVAGYILMSAARNGQHVGLSELAGLAAKADTLPLTRIVISFFNPTMTYKKGSKTLEGVGLNVSDSGDYGFAQLKASIDKLRASGLEVFLSMGGWNYNCWSALYMRYSVGGYGPNTPNYWKIEKFGNGNMNNCNVTNQFCWVCEPPSEGTSMSDFAIFPEPYWSSTWQEAAEYVEANAKGNQTPQWNYDILPGATWVDNKTSISLIVPGRSQIVTEKTDPYSDMVDLAVDLGADGVDLDYEEFWHADYFKVGDGPWTLPQTVYKYAAIARTFMLHIQAKAPLMKLSTASAAVGGWSTNWWGGNLKGVWYFTNQWYPEVVDFMTNSTNGGGINVMTYDLSDNPQYHECPEENICTLSQQVDYYMQTYSNNSIPANVGYEIGTPAYPDPTHDPVHQLPLTHSELETIISNTQPNRSGFFWEMFKPINNTNEATPTQVAQAICNKILPGNSRCSGTIPNITSLIQPH